MKRRILFEGQLGDDPIDKVLPSLIERAQFLNDDVFLMWNSVTLCVKATDTVDTIMKEYQRKLHALSLLQQEKEGELITKNELKEKVSAFVDNLFK